jgi:membrane-bound lytic murein transglycosylase D
MEAAFAKVGVPIELTRLSLVESSFDLKAKSKVGAAGVWQFMLATGKEYMKVEPKGLIDERLSPLKSTVAAAKLLKRNQKILGNWAFAVTAYNSGHGKMPRNLRLPKDGAKVYEHFHACTKAGRKLGYAGRAYYSEFLAVLHAEAYRHLYYGETPVQKQSPRQYQLVTAPQTGLKIAMAHSISVQEFQFLNPDIRDLNKPLPKGFWVAVPAEVDDLAGLTEPRRVAATKARYLVMNTVRDQ